MSWKKVVGWGFFWLFLLGCPPIRADELVAKNGERLTGKIASETADSVEFESTTFGTLRIARKDIARLERTAPAAAEPAELAPAGPAAPPDQAAGSGASRVGPSGGAPPPRDKDSSGGFQDKMETFFEHLAFMKKWKTSVGFGCWYRRGDDSDNNMEIKFRSERLNPLNREYLFEYRYYRKDNVSAEGVKTVDDDTTLGEFRFRQKLSQRWFFQANSRYYRDPMVSLMHEQTVTGGFGYKVVDRPTFKLSAIPAVGPQYADYGPQEQGWHFVVGAYQDLQWDLTQYFKFRQSVYFFQDPFNRASHALRFHLEQTQQVTKHFVLGFSYDYTFDGEVGAHIKQNQQRLGLNFGMEF